MSQAYVRLTAMKMFAYRALDYVHAAGADERRYQLFTSVQKAKVSTEGEKVIALLAECIGARGFESETYFEMARRDVALIPSLEGSVHLNIAHAAQFIPRYFSRSRSDTAIPQSLACSDAAGENPYLMEARTGGMNTITFPHFLRPYKPLSDIANIRMFARQAKAFELFVRKDAPEPAASDTPLGMCRGQIIALAAYAQLIAENTQLLNMPARIVSTIFHLLVLDMNGCALKLASLAQPRAAGAKLARRMVMVPQTSDDDWESIAARIAGCE
jgi:acyl-CoA dehydrogenase